MRADWSLQAEAALARGATALVTVLATAGSTPREAGTRMLVSSDGSIGTIGGGVLEWRACALARELLAQPPGSWQVQDYTLGAAAPARAMRCSGSCGECAAHAQADDLLGQCCGGRVRLLLERLDPARSGWLRQATLGRTLLTRLRLGRLEHRIGDAPPQALSLRAPAPAAGALLAQPIGPRCTPLYLFGAGHVGIAIARALHGLPFALAWSDPRADLAAAAGAEHLQEAALLARAAAAPAAAMLLILTHDHALDYRLTAAALRGQAGFVGLIGSASKRARFLSRLRHDGLGEAAQARLTCPIGLPGIDGKAPAVIALAVAAQVLLRASALDAQQPQGEEAASLPPRSALAAR
ncbi:xanthine dehydrogenase accessory protein xdhc [Xanthomonas translucens pv. poae]|uniref:Xanthine dehydrogenase accessory protein xdhc n=1 Tax=Xanthomonas graminis pv. poae TaxID=227946 RepID=A0A0K2ZKL8_9XANT|nr:xanthine dehydrogenase accessory protein XdhC [Xanthomonas translucens]UKE61203.1 xanthine dehydrogenase accessory protein XdhC [Xanthomonas translucens pv. poae]CTP83935.1 xanthine dehydrogenase accessory protein xdhc [Xanthomonas translucens pv. poae]